MNRDRFAVGGMPRYRLLAVIILAAAAILYFANLGKTPLRVNAETRCHDIVDGMLTSGDYLMPRLPGKLLEPEFVERVNKPPLFYWVSLMSVRLHGAMDLFWFRLPSVLAALGTLLLVMQWGRELNSPAVGLVAAVFLSLTYLFVVEARRGTFEMLLTLLSGLTILLCYRLYLRPGWTLALAATLLFGLAFLTKATPILVIALMPLLAWLIGMRRLDVLKDYRLWILLLFGLGIGLSWHLYLVAFRPESRDRLISELLLPFGVEVETKVSTSATHFGPPWTYLFHIWRNFFPASLLIPAAAIWIWQKRFFPADSPWRLLLLSFVAPFIVFSIIPQKQNHYLLPLMPALSLLGAGACVHGLESFSRLQRLGFMLPAVLVFLTVLVLASSMAMGLPLVADFNVWIGVLAGLLGVACCVVQVWSMKRGNWVQVLASGTIGIWLGWFSYFAYIRPVEDNFGSGRIFSDPTYNEAAWNAKFEKYPYLKDLLDVDEGVWHAYKRPRE